VQIIAPSLSVAVIETDLTAFPEPERTVETRRLVGAAVAIPFELSRGPLLRVQLFRLAEHDHVLLLCIHHIVFDGWSSAVLDREISVLYNAIAAGRAPALPAPRIQYADFAQWQREWLQGDVLATQLAYWKRHLAGLPALELPTDHARPPVQSYRGATLSFSLPPDLAEKLKALCRREGVTLFMALLAAFQTLLARYTGQTDIVVGSPIANRNRAETADLIGFFVNTLVLRTNVSGDPTFRALLGRTRDMALGAFAHEDLPFETLVDELQPERALNQSPLVQVMFAVQNVPADDQPLAGLTRQRFDFARRTSTFDLTMALAESDQGLDGLMEYRTDLFEPATIQRMVDHYTTLLLGIVADPSQRLSALPLLPEAERRQVLVEWNATAAPYPASACIQDLVEVQAARAPESLAVDGAPDLSYGELDRRANQLGHYLQTLGVGTEAVVGVLLERSADLVVALLGVLKAGAAYLPLDPAYPPERLAAMLADAGAPVLVTQTAFMAKLPELRACPVLLDRDWPAIRQQPLEAPFRSVAPANLAYVIYTSGSTGTPKGVGISQRGLVNLVRWHQRTYQVTPADRATLLAGLAFDASVWELWPYLAAGASVHIPDDDTRASPAALVRWLAKEGVT
ncbi:MAG TPA: condensation domain-containing protein, partial [Chloroflexota bacterium]|nr:condensation domain-containing protein [Chloroflexota bacterium]